MVFSNNMEYDNDQIEPIQGAFYATPSYDKPYLIISEKKKNLI